MSSIVNTAATHGRTLARRILAGCCCHPLLRCARPANDSHASGSGVESVVLAETTLRTCVREMTRVLLAEPPRPSFLEYIVEPGTP